MLTPTEMPARIKFHLDKVMSAALKLNRRLAHAQAEGFKTSAQVVPRVWIDDEPEPELDPEAERLIRVGHDLAVAMEECAETLENHPIDSAASDVNVTTPDPRVEEIAKDVIKDEKKVLGSLE